MFKTFLETPVYNNDTRDSLTDYPKDEEISHIKKKKLFNTFKFKDFLIEVYANDKPTQINSIHHIQILVKNNIGKKYIGLFRFGIESSKDLLFPKVYLAYVYKDYQGQGISKAIYLYLIDTFGGLISDNDLTGGDDKPGSIDTWVSLSKMSNLYSYVARDNHDDTHTVKQVSNISKSLMGRADEVFVLSKYPLNLTLKEHLKEWIEEKKPSKVSHSKIVKNSGTVMSKIVDQYKFTTMKGNIVKVHFDIRDNGAEIVFYVNDALSDDSSKTEGSDYDTEILSGVLWVVKYIADKKGLTELRFDAWKSKDDFKIRKNIDIIGPTKKLLLILDKCIKIATDTEKVVLPITQARLDLSKKFNMPLRDVYNFNKEELLERLQVVKQSVEEGKDLRSVHSTFHDVKIFDPKDLEDAIKVYNVAYQSNTEEGFKDTSNRRLSLYRKLIAKNMIGWKVEQYGESFILRRGTI